MFDKNIEEAFQGFQGVDTMKKIDKHHKIIE